MRFAYQTIIWGQYPQHLERAFQVISDAGFHGVELFQDPADLRENGEHVTWERLNTLLAENGLDLLGLSGGSLASRIKFLKENRTPYLYVDRWEPDCTRYLSDGWRLAIHPHYLKKLRAGEQAFELLRRHRNLLYIPDTAHAEIVGEDILIGLREFESQLACVHIKDWTSAYGRTSLSYARGFTILGQGQVGNKISAVLAHLRERSFDGWVVVEQDYAEGIIEASVQESARWLNQRGWLPEGRLRITPTPQIVPPAGHGPAPWSMELPLYLSNLPSTSLGQLSDRLAKTLLDAFPKRFSSAVVWSISELQELYVYQGSATSAEGTISSDLFLSWRSLDSLEQLGWHDGHLFSCAVRDSLSPGAGRLRITIPSPWNPNQKRIAIELFAHEDPRIENRDLELLVKTLAGAYDGQIEKIIGSWIAEINLLASRTDALDSFIADLRQLVRKKLPCDAVAMFLVDETNARITSIPEIENLREGCLQWLVPEGQRFYERGDGRRTTAAWESKMPDFINRGGLFEAVPDGKSVLRRQHEAANHVLAFPIVDVNFEFLGILRCANKVGADRSHVCHFCDDDLVIIDRAMQVAISSIRMRKSEAEEEQRLMIATHEFKRPISALRGTLSNLREEIEYRVSREGFREFQHDYLGDALMWGDLLKAVAGKAALFATKPDQLRPAPTRTLLEKDLIAGTVRSLRSELRERELPDNRINYYAFKEIPPLYVDRIMLQQVFFNLLDNAIKYALPNRRSFRVDVVAKAEDRWYSISVRDWGIGIPENARPTLFRRGVRAQNAISAGVSGMGVGLWLSKKLVELHGGRLEFGNTQGSNHSTEVVVRLPISLRRSDWRK